MHRDNDQPAVIDADGTQMWFIHDTPHRDNDQPAVIDADGSQEWYIKGELSYQEYYINGQLHRDNYQPATQMCCLCMTHNT